MPFSEEDKVLIKHYRMEKGYSTTKLLNEFPHRNWTKGGLDHLLAKIDATGSFGRKKGSGRPKSARNLENIVAEPDASQEEDAQKS